MSTNSWIGQETENGEIRYVYCHWDGHPNSVGAILLEHYQKSEKVTKLIDHGDISALREDIGRKHDAQKLFGIDYTRYDEIPCKKNGWTTFRHRDYNDPWEDCKPDILTFKNMIYNLVGSGISYVYIFTRKRGWVWFDVDKFAFSLEDARPLTVDDIIKWLKDGSCYYDSSIEQFIQKMEEIKGRVEQTV